jgi:hypothetical protein
MMTGDLEQTGGIAGLARRTLLSIVLPLAALLSFCGGPLFVFDAIEPAAGTPGAMLIAFAPVLVAALCAFSLWRGHRLSLGPWGVAAGFAAVALISAMSGFAISQLGAARLPRPELALLLFGVAMGAAVALAYLWLAWRRFTSAAS